MFRSTELSYLTRCQHFLSRKVSPYTIHILILSLLMTRLFITYDKTFYRVNMHHLFWRQNFEVRLCFSVPSFASKYTFFLQSPYFGRLRLYVFSLQAKTVEKLLNNNNKAKVDMIQVNIYAKIIFS